MKSTLSRFIAIAALASVAPTAWASSPVQLPEAGSLGLLAAGVAAGVAALRLRRRK